MREVAWVIFDEIHYMRDKGLPPPFPDFNNSILIYRTRSRMGRNHHPITRQSALRVPLRHHPQRPPIRAVDRKNTYPALPRRLHGFPSHAAAALSFPRGRRRDIPCRRRRGEIPGREFSESNGGVGR